MQKSLDRPDDFIIKLTVLSVKYNQNIFFLDRQGYFSKKITTLSVT